MATSEFGTGKSVFVLAVVVGCFAILWPKIFYPMLQAAFTLTMPKQLEETRITPASCGMMFVRDMQRDPVFVQTCGLIIDNEDDFWACIEKLKKSGNYTLEDRCRKGILQLCGFDLAILANETAKAEPSEAWRLKEEMTHSIILCQRKHFPKRLKPRRKFEGPGLPGGGLVTTKTLGEKSTKQPESSVGRPPHLHPGMMPPRIREAMGEARPEQLFSRVERDGRPFPHPSSRQPPKPQPKTGGAMSVIMPLYSLGILVFFLYTIFKMAFKKNGTEADNKKPMVKDFHMDPEYRKLLFSEEYENEAAPVGDSSSDQMTSQHAKRNGQTNGTVTNTMTVRESIESYGKDKDETNLSEKDYEIYRLRKRLEETEAAMSRIMKHMGIANDRMAAGVLNREPAHPPKTPPIIGTVPPFTKPQLNNKELTEMEKRRQSTSSKWTKQENNLGPSRDNEEDIVHVNDRMSSDSSSQQSSPDIEGYELLNRSIPTTPSEERANEVIEEGVVGPISASTTFSSSSSFENIENVIRNGSENVVSSNRIEVATTIVEKSEGAPFSDQIPANTVATSNEERNGVSERSLSADDDDDDDDVVYTKNNHEADDAESGLMSTSPSATKNDGICEKQDISDDEENTPEYSDKGAEKVAESIGSIPKQEGQRNPQNQGTGKRRKRHRHRMSNRGNNTADVPNGVTRNAQ